LKTKKISSAILEEIRRMITSGELKEGDKLPNQNEFAAQLGVSRPSLREALQVLSQLGAIEQRPGAGTILKARTAALMSAHMDLPLISDAGATNELMEARRLVEVGLARMAAERAEDQEVAEIGRILRAMEKAARSRDREAFSESDLLFHHLVALAAHNRFVTILFQNLSQAFSQLLKEVFLVLPEMQEVALGHHREIHQALTQRDQDRAARAMDDHIISGVQALDGYYRQGGPGRKKVG
jgi:GntR family transcriptional repressor for pyruvate dehydrogenase complex